MSEEVNKKIDEYISLITQNFLDVTYNIKILKILEKKRIKYIRKSIILILKVYNNIPLTQTEKLILNSLPKRYDIKTETEKFIAFICYHISYDTWETVNKIHINLFKTKNYNNYYYDRYLFHLNEYICSLRNSFSYNIEIELTDQTLKNKIHPKINYDDPYLVKYISKKRTFNKR